MIADSTRPEYWVAIGVGGIILLVGMVAQRLRGWVPVTLAILGTVAVAGSFLATYSALGHV